MGSCQGFLQARHGAKCVHVYPGPQMRADQKDSHLRKVPYWHVVTQGLAQQSLILETSNGAFGLQARL